MEPGWGKISAASRYSGVSKDTFEKFCKNGLRFVRLDSGTRLFRFAWIDAYLENFEVNHDAKNKVDEIVNETIDGLMNDQKKGARNGRKA